MKVTLDVDIDDYARNLIACQHDSKQTKRLARSDEVVIAAREALLSKLMEWQILGPRPKRKRKQKGGE